MEETRNSLEALLKQVDGMTSAYMPTFMEDEQKEKRNKRKLNLKGEYVDE